MVKYIEYLENDAYWFDIDEFGIDKSNNKHYQWYICGGSIEACRLVIDTENKKMYWDWVCKHQTETVDKLWIIHNVIDDEKWIVDTKPPLYIRTSSRFRVDCLEYKDMILLLK